MSVYVNAHAYVHGSMRMQGNRKMNYAKLYQTVCIYIELLNE